MKPIMYLILMFICFAGLLIWAFQVDSGETFCIRHGYDSISLYGTYSKMYGKIECESCYKNDCIYKEFNVTDKFGIIVDDEEYFGLKEKENKKNVI